MAKRYYTASFHNGGKKEDTKDTKGNGKAVKFQANREHNIRDEEYCKNQEHIQFKNKTEKEHEEWAKTHILLDEKPEDAYERIFGEAVKKYDERQKRSDRKIGSGRKYYEKIKKSKNKVPVYEFIITLGNKDNLPDNPGEVREIYIEALNNFKTRNPNLEVIGAYYHDDEVRDDGKGGKIQGAPHLHVDYIPVSRNRWQNFIDEQNKKESILDKLTGKENTKKTRVNGLDVENSLTEALAGQGFISKEIDVSVIEKKFGIHINEKHYKNPEQQAQYEKFMNSRVDSKGRKIKTRLLTAQMQWIKSERDCLIHLFEKHGYKIKNPGEHRPHLETQDYIESKDSNLQEKNLKLYNDISAKLSFLEEEEKSLTEREEDLDTKQKELEQTENEQKKKQNELNQKEITLNDKDTRLKEREKLVEKAEEQLEKARLINEETKEYKADIEKIRTDLYQDVKSDIDKEYREKYQELSNTQKSLDEKEVELNKQKEEQKKKEEELSERERNVEDLEFEKWAVDEKEQSLIKKEANITLAEAKIKDEEKKLKNRESLVNQTEEKNNKFQKEYESKRASLTEIDKEYNEKKAFVDGWEDAISVVKEEDTDAWIDREFNDCVRKKQTLDTFIKKIKTGIKGIVAKVKKLYDKKLNGYDFINEKGVKRHQIGSLEIQKNFMKDANANTFRQIANDMDKEGVINYGELYKKNPGYLKKHFESERERYREEQHYRSR